MSLYYNPGFSPKVFLPRSTEPFRLSRSKIDLFLKCARCFFLDRRMGIAQPPCFPFTLNNAVDLLLKKEFDTYRISQTKHPLMEAHGIDAVPFLHEKLELWREARKAGISYHHLPTNFVVHGGIDDVWINSGGELIIVDYKATSKNTAVNIDAEWQKSYKRQVEVYQWLFRQNGFPVSRTSYFVYCNADATKEGFYGRLEFSLHVIPYDGDDSWIEPTLQKARDCLMKDSMPKMAFDCDFCRYRKAIRFALVKPDERAPI